MENPLALVGRPYAFPSHPPETFDCWSLVRYVREQMGLRCPLPFNDAAAWCVPENIRVAVERARPSWSVVPVPSDLAMAVMSRHHVGIVFGRGVLHALARHATVVWTGQTAILRRWPDTEWWTA